MTKTADPEAQQVLRAVLHEPLMELPIVPIVPKPTAVSWWHWWCRYGTWGAVFSANSAGLLGAFTGGVGGPWWQHRVCTVCNRAQRRRVELPGDR